MLLDVRLASDYADCHAAGAVSAPLYRPTAGDATWDKVKRLVMASLAMQATERDPAFLESVAAATRGDKRRRVVVMCAVGGTLDTVTRVASTGKTCSTDKDRAFGRQGRVYGGADVERHAATRGDVGGVLLWIGCSAATGSGHRRPICRVLPTPALLLAPALLADFIWAPVGLCPRPRPLSFLPTGRRAPSKPATSCCAPGTATWCTAAAA